MIKIDLKFKFLICFLEQVFALNLRFYDFDNNFNLYWIKILNKLNQSIFLERVVDKWDSYLIFNDEWKESIKIWLKYCNFYLNSILRWNKKTKWIYSNYSAKIRW